MIINQTYLPKAFSALQMDEAWSYQGAYDGEPAMGYLVTLNVTLLDAESDRYFNVFISDQSLVSPCILIKQNRQ